ncbi:MAG: DUF1631 family protein [Ramlibacter sp.]
MPAQSAALQQCFNEAAKSAPQALERCLKHVITALQEAESATSRPNERTELGEAWRELMQHQMVWCRAYPDELRIAFTTASKPKGITTTPPAAGRGAGLTLTLVDDAKIVEAIESSRLVQHVMPMVERPVSELDALVSSALGLDTIQPELNPVRPEVFAQALRTVIGRTQLKPSTGSMWMKHIAEPLGHELQDLYGRLVTQLRSANVQEAEYRVVQGEGGPRTTGPAPLDGKPETEAEPTRRLDTRRAAAYGNLSSKQISHTVLRDFLFHGGDDHAAQALPPAFYEEVEGELAALEVELANERIAPALARIPAGYREMASVDRPARTVGVQTTLSAKEWGDYAHSNERSLVRSRLRKDATKVAQVLGLELVRKVVNQIAQDPLLLAPVREAIVALEPSLLRLAMVDPRFFSDVDHPGRVLMERVAQRSFKFNDEFSPEFGGFFEQVRYSFNSLNQATIEGAETFEQALGLLEEAWARQDQRDEEQQEAAVKAMRFAELRQLEADRIAWELSSRTDLAEVPSVVQDFLFGPWSLVLAHARLADTQNQIDPGGYRSLISDLLWSVKPEVTLKQPAQLFERVPRLVTTLRAGLATLGQDPEESEPFFQSLMDLHRPVLKLRRAKSRHDARESGIAPLAPMDKVIDEAEPVLETPAKRASLWLSRGELSAAGFQETLPTDMADLYAEESGAAPLAAQVSPAPQHQAAPTPQAQPVAAAAAAPAAAAGASATGESLLLADMREGAWFDLYSKQHWLRAQLIWASSKATLFMFVSHGGQPHTMTKRICERLIKERHLRAVRTHAVVDKALRVLDESA